MADFILFGTEGCHLCEEAESLLLQVGLVFDKQDIVVDEVLMQRYGVRIPVLLHQGSGLELGWPFSVQAVEQFIARCCCE